MSHVYIVVATRDSEIENCEAFAGAQSALGRAFQLASDKSGRGRTDLFNASPSEEHMSDGSVRWVFMDTNKQSVTVIFRKIEDSLLSSKDPLSVLPSTVILPPAPPIHPLYDFMDRSLPAGWTVDGKPALMGDLLDDPLNVQDPSSLSDVQQRALVIARIRKSPGWHATQPIRGYTFFRDEALNEILSCRLDGTFLKEGEILSLHSLREDLVSGALKAV
jgi:hypothetical protein